MTLYQNLFFLYYIFYIFQVKGRIYVFGGSDCSSQRAEAYYYTAATNTWTQISNVPWGGSLDIISTIIKNKNGDRWLIISKERHTTMVSQ